MRNLFVISLLFCQLLAVSTALGQCPPQSLSDVCVTLTPNHNPSAFNQAVTFTITWTDGWGGTPSASVELIDRFNGQNITIASGYEYNGSVAYSTSALAIGTHEIIAYVNTSLAGTPTSTSLMQTVTKATPTVALSAGSATVATRENATLTATVSPNTATGMVTFRDGSIPLGTAEVVNGIATLATSFMTTGSRTLFADYGGDEFYTTTTGSTDLSVLDPTVTISIAPQAGQAILSAQSDPPVTGYFTLHKGTDVPCGIAAQVIAGQTYSGASAQQHGSLALVTAVNTSYAVRNLTHNSAYTACFTTASLTAPQSRNFSTSAEAGAGNNWIAEGDAGFSGGTVSHTRLVFAPDGAPWVAYVDGSSCINGTTTRDIVTNYATVQWFDGNSWVTAGVCGFGNLGEVYSGDPARLVLDGMDQISLAFSPAGTPYVALTLKQHVKPFSCRPDDTACNPTVAPGRVTRVMRFDGSGWVTVGNYWPDGASPSLAFAPDGTPWVAYSSQDDGNRVKVRRFDGTGWVMATPGQFPVSNAQEVSLAFAPNGAPNVVFSDTNNGGKATLMMLANGSWTLATVADTAADNLSLAFDGDSVPYLAYRMLDGSSKAMVAKLSADQSGWLAEPASGSSDNLALAVSPGGAPYLAYQAASTGKLMVKTFEGGAWHFKGDTGVSAGQTSYASLAFTPAGQLYTAYSDATLANAAAVMKAKFYTTLTISSTVNPMYAGDQSGTINAQISCNTAAAGQGDFSGSIAFKDGSAVLGSGDFYVGSFGTVSHDISSLGAGSHTISAEYAGNGLCDPATSSSLVQVVNKRPSITTISSNTNPAYAGDLDSTITAITDCDTTSTIFAAFSGSITFQEGDTILGIGTFNPYNVEHPNAEFTTSLLSLGSHNITAVFAGDGWCDASSATLQQSIIQPPLARNKTKGISYATVAEALTAANPTVPDELLLLGASYSDMLILTKGVLLNGGWNPYYDKLNGLPTTLVDGLEVGGGDSVLGLIDVVGSVTVTGGSLRAKGVRVK